MVISQLHPRPCFPISSRSDMHRIPKGAPYSASPDRCFSDFSLDAAFWLPTGGGFVCLCCTLPMSESLGIKCTAYIMPISKVSGLLQTSLVLRGKIPRLVRVWICTIHDFPAILSSPSKFLSRLQPSGSPWEKASTYSRHRTIGTAGFEPTSNNRHRLVLPLNHVPIKCHGGTRTHDQRLKRRHSTD